MLGSEGARRFVALIAVAAGVGAQSFITQDVVADQNRQANLFGVRLLAAELSAPVSPIDPDPVAIPEPELLLGNIGPSRVLYRPLPNRDSAGSLIELTENDVLIPVRLDF